MPLEWSLKRPSLEYRHAFDICAVGAHRSNGRVLIFASSLLYTQEILKRLADCQTALVARRYNSILFGDARANLGPEISPSVSSLLLENTSGPVQTIVWAEPELPDGVATAKNIEKLLLPGGQLFVISSGWLARLLPEWRHSIDAPARHPTGFLRMANWVQHAGLKITATYGMRDVKSFLMGVLAGQLHKLKRKDLAYRLYLRIRETLVVSGPAARWSPVVVLIACKS